MGLDAVFYRNKEHLQLGLDEERAKVDPGTGEVYFDEDRLARKYDHQLKAISCRLGNIARITALRDEVARLIGPGSFLGRKVLYSGVHSGDSLPVEELDELSAELSRIRDTGRSSAHVRELAGALGQLIQAAKNEGNPIVFV